VLGLQQHEAVAGQVRHLVGMAAVRPHQPKMVGVATVLGWAASWMKAIDFPSGETVGLVLRRFIRVSWRMWSQSVFITKTSPRLATLRTNAICRPPGKKDGCRPSVSRCDGPPCGATPKFGFAES
jgi:hypothetical protein